jgi:hypothetical protein
MPVAYLDVRSSGQTGKHLLDSSLTGSDPMYEVMRTDTGLHADQIRRQVGEARFHLPTRPFLPHHNRTAPGL